MLVVIREIMNCPCSHLGRRSTPRATQLPFRASLCSPILTLPLCAPHSLSPPAPRCITLHRLFRMAATRRGDVTLPCRCGFFHLPPCRFRPACRLRRRSGREGGVALFLAAVAFVVTVTACTAVAAPTAATTAPSMPSLVTAAVDAGGADTVIDDADLPPITAAFRGHLFGSPSAHDEAVAMGLDPSGNL